MTPILALLAALATLSTHWRIEAESEAARVLLRGDTLDITTPGGLSLWWDEPLRVPCAIEYRACVVMEGGPCDRLSDLNCFWMATEPRPAQQPLSPLENASRRHGRFVECYRLQCYYFGFGGNYNTTSRFRRYDGDTLAIDDERRRPHILTEYTDSAHLLQPNHWYAIRIQVDADGRTRYFLDGECLVDYRDPAPLLHGWFAFRTTWSHIRLTGFCINNLL